MTHHNIDWIHKYRKYKSKYFELKQHMGLNNLTGGSAQPLDESTDAAELDGAKAKSSKVEGKTPDAKAKSNEVEGKTPDAKANEKIKDLITIQAMNGAQPTCGKISPGGLFILVGYDNGQCCIYRMSTGEMILKEPLKTQCSKINAVAWADGGSMLFVVAGESNQTSAIVCRINYNNAESTEDEIANELDNIGDISILTSDLNTHSKSIEYIQWKKNVIISGYNDNDQFKILLFMDDIDNNEELELNDDEMVLDDTQVDLNDEEIEINTEDNDLLKGGNPKDMNDDVIDIDSEQPEESEANLDEINLDEGLDAGLDEVVLDENVEESPILKPSKPLEPFEEHECKVKGKGMTFNADATKLAIIVDDDSTDKIVIINVNIDGSPKLTDKEYIIKSNIKPKKITSVDNKLLLLGDGLEEIDISDSINETETLQPNTIDLVDLTSPIICSYNPVTLNELLVCSQEKLCIYDTNSRQCIDTIQHKLEPNINDVDWHSSNKHFFVTITDKEIRVWCMNCESANLNRHITCNNANVCTDDNDSGESIEE